MFYSLFLFSLLHVSVQIMAFEHHPSCNKMIENINSVMNGVKQKLPTDCKTLFKEQEKLSNFEKEFINMTNDQSKKPLTPLKPIFENQSKQDQEKLLIVKYYNKCHKALFDNCYPSLKETIYFEELKILYQEIIKSSLFRMERPGGLCYQRAYLLAKKITEMGYSARTAQIYSSSIKLTSKGTEGNQEIYDDHGVVVISVKVKNNQIKDFVLDPQFFDLPVEKESYQLQAIGSICSESQSQEKGCLWIEGAPTQAMGPNDPIIGVYSPTLKLLDSCGWSQINFP